MKYATLQAGVDFFHGIRIASELRPNCVRIVSESCKTMYGRINERKKRKDD